MPELITQHTPTEKMIDIILSDRKTFLLSDEIERQLELMRITRNLYFDYGAPTKVVNQLVRSYKLSERTAWRYVEITPRLYSMAWRTHSREFHIDLHLQKIEETYRMAKEADDIAGMNGANKAREAAIEKFLGTSNMLKPEDLQLPAVEIGYHPEYFNDLPKEPEKLEAIKSRYRKRKEISQKMQAIDIDYEETFE